MDYLLTPALSLGSIISKQPKNLKTFLTFAMVEQHHSNYWSFLAISQPLLAAPAAQILPLFPRFWKVEPPSNIHRTYTFRLFTLFYFCFGICQSPAAVLNVSLRAITNISVDEKHELEFENPTVDRTETAHSIAKALFC